MASRVCLVHYHEIGLKGNNRARFERIIWITSGGFSRLSDATITRISGHILVTFSVSARPSVHSRLSPKFRGRSRLLRFIQTEPGEYCAAAIKALEEFGEFNSFKVVARRSTPIMN